ncbi:methyltransferase domain-containing protein [Iamia sp. SCSIO 61187]|uniref:class I SAM-dependent methyltransferase n=1 Tax=Iamia sp. SCSIO 61187 TaxID=2722752 RepID=UPI001C638621|nr:class I SAM-dependent methyltransferase [Iamia sp. SCSIO 61187]QYG92226.1 methyltransferase domain-containing protein [Iamia sp. SCSIO 61187]
MTTIESTTPTPALDEDALVAFVGRAVTDVGTVLGGSMAVLGDRLGLYRAMAGAGPVTAAELADRTGTVERYVREWLSAQAATGYVTYEGDDRFSLPAEHAVVLTDERSPACVIGAFETALAALHSTDRLAAAFRDGSGVGWGEHHHDLYEGCERFFRPGYQANLVSTWLPALSGVEEKLRAGAQVADIGCGHGASTVLMAAAYPSSTFTGFDAHAGSIDEARRRAAAAGVADRTAFETRTVSDVEGTFDLVCFFDCLHDMGDPVGALTRVREVLAADGTVMLVEPMAADRLEDNLNPVGAAYYGFSTLLCTPSSLSQDVGAALGAQAGEARLREVADAAGFTTLRRVAETPFNMVLELRR